MHRSPEHTRQLVNWEQLLERQYWPEAVPVVQFVTQRYYWMRAGGWHVVQVAIWLMREHVEQGAGVVGQAKQLRPLE
jgi:hypothetical protein